MKLNNLYQVDFGIHLHRLQLYMKVVLLLEAPPSPSPEGE